MKVLSQRRRTLLITYEENYQEVEYIESYGGAYVMLDGTIEIGDTIKFDIAFFDDNTRWSHHRFFGAVDDINDVKRRCGVSLGGTNRTHMEWQAGTEYANWDGAESLTTGSKYTCEIEIGENYQHYAYLIDNTVVDETTITNPISDDVMPINSPALFARTWNGVVATSDIYGLSGSTKKLCSLYKFEWFDKNGNYKKLLIPKYGKISGEIGLYDEINKKFYENKGSKSFEKGADVL